MLTRDEHRGTLQAAIAQIRQGLVGLLGALDRQVKRLVEPVVVYLVDAFLHHRQNQR